MNEIIRFDDRLVYHGSYYLSPRAVKTILYIVARHVNPLASDLPSVVLVPVAALANAITDGREEGTYKSLYRELNKLCSELTSTNIGFNSDIKVEGIDLQGYLTWCSSALPKTQNGVKYIEFVFGLHISQFLLGLSKYVRLYRPEVNRLTTGYAIRLFQMLKGDRNKKEKYGAKSVRVFNVKRLRFLFGLKEKYADFKDFNRYILKPSIKQINERTTVRVIDIKYFRRENNRTVSHIELHFISQGEDGTIVENQKPSLLPDYIPTEDDIEKLSRSESEAYGLLVVFGVKPGIAYRRLLPEIKGSESYGFEDYFVCYALDHFRQWSKNTGTKEQAAATFVNWWIKHRIFDTTSDVWIKINERVVMEKKNLERQHPERFENRHIAREMTKIAFAEWYKDSLVEEAEVIN